MNKITLDLIDGVETLVCDCGAKCKDTSKHGGRFVRRHPKLCSERKGFTAQLAAGTRIIVDADGWREDLQDRAEVPR